MAHQRCMGFGPMPESKLNASHNRLIDRAEECTVHVPKSYLQDPSSLQEKLRLLYKQNREPILRDKRCMFITHLILEQN